MPTRAAKPQGESAAVPVVMDFTNVKDRGAFNPKHKPEGDYRAKITKVVQTVSNQGNNMWVFTVTLPGDSQASYAYRCVLDEANAWKVRNVFLACGMNVPKKRLRVDPNKAVNKEVGITLEDDEYEGKVRSSIAALFPVSELPSSTARKTTSSGRTAKPADDDEEEEIEEEDIEDEDEMEVDEL